MICKLIGHKWQQKIVTFSNDHMFRYTRWKHFPYCLRCGEPNPNKE